MTDYHAVFNSIVDDHRYESNLEFQTACYGGQVMTTRAYLLELDLSLECLKSKLSTDEYWKIKILIHTHDTFKRDATSGVTVSHPRSHASLAAKFLREKCDDDDLIMMLQYHDETFVLHRQFKARKVCDPNRLVLLIGGIKDWSLFVGFHIVLSAISDRGRDHLVWLLQMIEGKVSCRFNAADIINRTIGSWPITLLAWRPEVAELSTREALAVFRRTDDCLNEFGYGLNRSQVASVEIMSVRTDHGEVTSWLAERIGGTDVLVVFGARRAFRMSPRVLLSTWEDLFDSQEIVISPVSNDWVMSYWHAEVFEFARFD